MIKWKNAQGKMPSHLPAIPPDDYRGSIANWQRGLIELGWDEESDYSDMMITQRQYNALLNWCESK